MLIVTHILIALLGLAAATYGLIVPSRRMLRVTYGLTAATFASGSYLVWHLHAPLVQSCLSGLTYLSIILVTTVLAQYRLRASRRAS